MGVVEHRHGTHLVGEVTDVPQKKYVCEYPALVGSEWNL